MAAATGSLAESGALQSDARNLLENPPDGVDLDALGAGAGQLLPPEECERLYLDAFRAAGGEAALEAGKELSASLAAEMAGGKNAPAHQLRVWQAYDLPSMMQRLGEGSAVRRHGERRLASLSQELRRAVHPEVELKVASVKKWGRASVKVRIKYASDCSQLCDLNRAELVCPSIDVMYSAARHIFDCWGPQAERQDTRLVEWEDRYQTPMPGGYRHLQLLAFIGGTVWELQLNTAPMLEAKHRAGHKLYKTTRFVKEMILLASMEGDVAVLRDLLAKPGVKAVANPNEACDKNGLTALHHAAFRGDEELLEVLLDGADLSVPADPWATDRSDYGGLPLSYALQMRSHRVAQALAERMAPPPSELSPAARSRLSEAAAAVIDAHEEALESSRLETDSSSSTSPPSEDFEEVGRITEDLLRTLSHLWQATKQDRTWKGMDPLAYAFHAKAESCVRILLECMDLWAVDEQGRLPIEMVVHLGFWSLVDRAVAKMSATQPLQVPADAAWSLARCRGANLPDELLGELQANDRRLQRRIYTCGPAKQLDVSVSHSGDGTVLRQSDALELRGLKEATPDASYRCMVLEDDILYVGTGDGSIDKWDVRTMESIGKWQAHSQRVSCLLLGSKRPYFDGTQRARKLFSGSFDNTVRIWDLWKQQDGHCIGVLKHTEDVRALARYGSVLFAAQGPRIALWDIAKVGSMRKSGELRGHSGLVDTLVFTGGLLLSAGQGGEIRVWGKAEAAPDQWSELSCWKGHSDQFRVRCIASDGDGRIFSAAHADAAGQYRGPGAWSNTVKDAKAELCVWTREGGLTSKLLAEAPIIGMHFMEGVLFTADLGGHVRLWNVASCQQFAAFPAHGGAIRAFLIGGGGAGTTEVEEKVEESEEECAELVRSRPPSSRQSGERVVRVSSAASDRSKAEQGRPPSREPRGTPGAGARPDSVTSSSTTRSSVAGRPRSGSDSASLPPLQPPRLPFFRSGFDRTRIVRPTRSGSRSRTSSTRVGGSSSSPNSRSPTSSASTDIGSWQLTPMQRGKAAAEVSQRALLPPRQPLDESYQPS